MTRSNSNNEQSLVVALTSSDIGEASVPLNVTIPAGQASAAFVLTGVDDTLLDGNQTVVISAKSGDYITGQASVTVADVEQLTVAFDAPSLAENASILGATVTRSNTDRSQELIVQLQADLAGLVQLPTSVTIPADQASVRFVLTSIDNDLLTGDRTLNVSGVSAGYNSPPSALKILDIEALQVTIDQSSISERNGTAVGKVRRSNSNIQAPLTVGLSSNKPNELSLPASVTIAAGASEATFTVSANDDNVLDGSQLVMITATSDGYQMV